MNPHSASRILPCGAALSALAMTLAPARAEDPPAAKAQPAPVAVQWTFSPDGSNNYQSVTLPPVDCGKTIPLAAEGRFTIDDPDALGGLTITSAGSAGGMTVLKDSELGKMGRFNCPLLFEAAVKLNSKDVSLAPPGLASDYFLLDASALVKGENTLSVKGFYCNMSRDLPGTEQGPLVPGFVVKPVERKDLDFQFGPVLGVVGPDFLTVTCRLNQQAVVTPTVMLLVPARGEAVTAPPSPRGVFHRIRLPLPAGTRAVSYTLTAAADGGKITKAAGPFTVKLPDFTGKTLRFAAMGQSDGGSWTKIAAAVLKTQPDLVVHTGVFNYFPQMEGPWSGALTPPEVRGLVATVPFYPVRGPSEFGDAVFDRIFFTPVAADAKTENWTQVIGPVRFVAIDGFVDWSENSPHLAWLEAVLKGATDKFVFVISTYPGYSNARWVRSPSGVLLQIRNVVLPLLGKHQATAMLSSFGHQYERCEVPPDKGVTCIVTAASGGMIRKASGRASNLNPYSTVYAARQHFCLFEVDGDSCTLKACDMDGQSFDTRVFTARSTATAR